MNVFIFRFLGTLAIIAVVGLPSSADANAPAGQYVVPGGASGNGTVYDTKSKLTWQQTVSLTRYAWSDAKTYCAGRGASLEGTGWRLPTIKELVSIMDHSQTFGPTIDGSAFPGTPTAWFYWSSSLTQSPSVAWDANFNQGYTYSDGVSNTGYVRCVR